MIQTLETIKQLYDYNSWANAEFLRYFQNATRPDEKAIRTFAHLLVAEKSWLERIANSNSDNTGKNFWAGESVEDCAVIFEENRQAYAEFFGELADENLAAVFAYRNSKGTGFKNTAREALTHVFLHSVYHRGQAAQAIRLSGAAPPTTDFIQYLRR